MPFKIWEKLYSFFQQPPLLLLPNHLSIQHLSSLHSKAKFLKEINPTQYRQPRTYLVVNLKINLTHMLPFHAHNALYLSQQLVYTAKFRQTKLNKVGGRYSFLGSTQSLPTSGSGFGSFTNNCTRFVNFGEETEVGAHGVLWCIGVFDKTGSS
jgi:hypothetical protein